MHSFVESKFLFSFDPDRFLSFLCKTKPSCEIHLVLHKCVFFRFKLLPKQVIFFILCAEKRNSVFVSVRPECYQTIVV